MKNTGVRVVAGLIVMALSVVVFSSVGCQSPDKSELTVFVANQGRDTLNLDDFFLAVGDSLVMWYFVPGDLGSTREFQIWRESGTLGTLKVKYVNQLAPNLKTTATVILHEPTANNLNATINKGAEYIEATYTPATH